MSTSFTYFFNNPKIFSILADDINNTLGCHLAPYEQDKSALFCRFLSMELSFGDNEGYVNDRELDYQNYKYNIEIRIPEPDNDLLCIALQTVASIAYALYARLDISQGMLVYDMQTLLAKYEKNNNGNWINMMNGETIEFPEHVNYISGIAWK